VAWHYIDGYSTWFGCGGLSLEKQRVCREPVRLGAPDPGTPTRACLTPLEPMDGFTRVGNDPLWLEDVAPPMSQYAMMRLGGHTRRRPLLSLCFVARQAAGCT
jgi:hypothetical protein